MHIKAASNAKDLSWGCGGKVETAQICLGMNRYNSLCSLPLCIYTSIKRMKTMNFSFKKSYLSALGMLTLFVAIPMMSGPCAHAQELASLNPLPTPLKPVVRTLTLPHKDTSTEYTDWLPGRVVWSNNLLRDVSKECSTFVGKYDNRFKISKEDPRDYGNCVVQLYDAVGSLRSTENWNPTFRPKSKRGQKLKVYLVQEYGTRRFGVYQLSELTHGMKAVN